MKKYLFIALMTLFLSSFVAVNASDRAAADYDEEVCDRDNPGLCYVVHKPWAEYEYVVRFINRTDTPHKVRYQFYDGEEWKWYADGAFLPVRAHDSKGGYPAGPEGKVRRVEWR